VLHFASGSHEQKTRNLESEPRCILTTGTNQLRGGLDVVVEGIAVRVADATKLEQLAALWKSKLDWDFEVTSDGFDDPEGRHALVFALEPTKVLAFGKAPFTQTRFRFR
jgi:hypothetical protein